MVTRAARAPLATQAVASLAAQSHPALELVIAADQGDGRLGWLDELADRALCGAVDRVRTVVLPGDPPLGALRNAAVAAADPDAFAHIQWDDDDLATPDRVTAQLAEFRDDPTIVCTCLTEQLYLLAPESRLFWVDWMKRRPRFSSVLIPGTICVRGARARACRYPEDGPYARKGEDGAYLQAVLGGGRGIGVAGRGDCYLRRFHGANTWGRSRFLGNARWLGLTAQALRSDDRRRRLGAALPHYRCAFPGAAVRVEGRDALAYMLDVAQGRADAQAPV
jgi:hypothetical protein